MGIFFIKNFRLLQNTGREPVFFYFRRENKMKRKSKVVIVGVDINREHEDFQYSMQELGNLAAACNLEVVSEVTQNLNYVNQANYIGTGKMQELQDMVRANQAIAVIFDDELSLSQIRNLEKALKCEV